MVSQARMGPCTALFPYKDVMYVNADMDEDMVPVMLFLRLVLHGSDMKMMPQFSRQLG